MEIKVDPYKLQSGGDQLIKKLWKTEPGRLASLLDEIIYEGQIDVTNNKVILYPDVQERDGGPRGKTWDVLVEVRDLLYRLSIQEVMK
jgi:hypothetical protein